MINRRFCYIMTFGAITVFSANPSDAQGIATPSVQRGKIVDPVKPPPMKSSPNFVDKTITRYQNAPIRPYGTTTPQPGAGIQYNKKY